ncbi:hypothetical protein FisN_15Hh187 [Fistulifera solaris]|uniref:Glutathione transferase n=1 Tax=Fistulifera solaris TaxID=1519565 RepID=A0A1Z5JG18_FISSO|nr:hypothetical protein FisN_15Hh187 [Fistulifera solaris]|eukprot:GAX12708.1 hypothetical protein FisN_15Hh187 [Fistulifera solaris]
MASLLAQCGVAACGLSYMESKLAPKGKGNLQYYAVTPTILIGMGFWVLTFGMKVGAARRKYKELAEKDGETEVAERYDLPNLYAQGTSKHARAFNCVQRAHQQIFETFPQVILSSLVAAWNFPLSTALATTLFCAGRVAFSNGYAAGEGDASQRYSSKLAKYMWHGIVVNTFLGVLSCAKMIMGDEN